VAQLIGAAWFMHAADLSESLEYKPGIHRSVTNGHDDLENATDHMMRRSKYS